MIVLSPAVLLAVVGWTHRWSSEDAFINFRVVDQLLHGNGPVFNVGERVEAFTSPVWVGILSAGAGIVGASHVEWVAVGIGLLLTVAGLVAASLGALTLLVDELKERALALPLGALAFAVLHPAWDFATSGLETGLSFGWLGGCFLLAGYLHRRERRQLAPREWPWDGLAVAAGLGILIRPDFAIFSAGFLVLAILLPGRLTARVAVRRIAVALALPLLYELFRMAYFAALVPNTALEKEGTKTDWSRGWTYLWDTLKPYLLLFPLTTLSAWSAAAIVKSGRPDRREIALLRGVPAATGALHLLYIVAIGGDFMHGRMALPGIFAILMPVAVVPVRRRLVDVALVAGVAGWAVACAVALRTPYTGFTVTSAGIADERAWYVSWSGGKQHPVTLYDYRTGPWARLGASLAQRAARGERAITFAELDEHAPELVPRPGQPHLIAVADNVGILGYAAGRGVYMMDIGGLGDPVASRQRLVHRGRAGHEKLLPPEWVVARFADMTRLPPRYVPALGAPAARVALGCGDLSRLLDAVDKPLTLLRALDNIGFSFASTRMRFSPDPAVARRELCT